MYTKAGSHREQVSDTYNKEGNGEHSQGLLPVRPDVDFHRRPNENDKIEGNSNSQHPKTAGKFRVKGWSSQELDGRVEVVDVFTTQHVNDREREESDHETGQTKKSRCSLDHGLIELGQ